jgi:hypothetical protein
MEERVQRFLDLLEIRFEDWLPGNKKNIPARRNFRKVGLYCASDQALRPIALYSLSNRPSSDNADP